MKIELPFWMGKGNSQKLIAALTRWYDYLQSIINTPREQLDAETSSIELVNLMAWERGIARFASEPEWLYRSRVKNAYANAKDAGSSIGFKRIWQRMGLGKLDITERIAGRDWDVIELLVEEETIADNPELLSVLVEMYGRTCRRYEYTTMSSQAMKMASSFCEQATANLRAVLYNTNTTHALSYQLPAANFGADSENISTSWLEPTRFEQTFENKITKKIASAAHATETLKATL